MGGRCKIFLGFGGGYCVPSPMEMIISTYKAYMNKMKTNNQNTTINIFCVIDYLRADNQ